MSELASASVLDQDVDQLSINTLRFLAVDAVQRANSGHPGMPMGAAAMAWSLWSRHLKHDPAAPQWANRDRFVLSAGHGSMLLYGLLHVFGYDLPMEQIKQFRQWGSMTPGHPENFVTPGVETTTGPLGQGFANGVGMAIAERFLAARFNRPGFDVVDHFTYGIVSDGDLMEGISHEAASLAGHLGLGKLVYLYDDNRITIEGSTDLAFTEDVPRRFEAYGWHVVNVKDGNDPDEVDEALALARAEPGRPSLISVHTNIGFGSPNKQDTASSHGSPLGAEEIKLTKRALGWPEDATFLVPDEVRAHTAKLAQDGAQRHAEWDRTMVAYRQAHLEAAAEFDAWMEGRLPDGWTDALPTFEVGSSMATRKASGAVLNAIAPAIGNLIGGSADLAGSNLTTVKDRPAQQRDTPEGGNFHFGVREHGMASICNGMVLHGGVRPYNGTFLIFSDYMRPAMRLSALMSVPVIYVLTHDSIGLGEDGPTHQPVEHHLALRAIPNLVYLRPADAAETAAAWRTALERTDGPTALALTRQSVKTQPETVAGAPEGVSRGGYVLRGGGAAPEVVLIATGSEVQLALEAADRLESEGVRVRVVSLPSWELFDAQPAAYRESVLPPSATRRVAVEAGVTLGWERYVGAGGKVVGLDRFGASAPADELFARFGITADRVANAARALMAD